MNQPKSRYDLEGRCLLFAKNTHALTKKLPRTIGNIEYAKQLVRSSASVGANYIEANEKLSKKDFMLRAKIAKKEARESRYWPQLIDVPEESETSREILIQESSELMAILATIIERVGKPNL